MKRGFLVLSFTFLFLAIFMGGIAILGSCTRKAEDSKAVAKWGNGYEAVPSVEKEDVLKVYHVTYESEPTDSSYWFVQLEFVREGGGTTTIHGAVDLPMPYFDFELARKDFSRKGECYFKYIQQITKEGYESFYRYSKNNE